MEKQTQTETPPVKEVKKPVVEQVLHPNTTDLLTIAIEATKQYV